MTDSMIESPLARLTPSEIEAIGEEFDAIHDEVFNSLGDRDAHYIRAIIALHRELALLSRAITSSRRYRSAMRDAQSRANATALTRPCRR